MSSMYPAVPGMPEGMVPTLPLYAGMKANCDLTPSIRWKGQAMSVTTPVDVMMYPSATAITIDLPGLKSRDIKVQVGEDNVLVISGESKREEEKKGAAKYVTTERKIGKYIRKFVLPPNANTETISALCEDGVLTVTVQKLGPQPPPEPKKEAKTKTIEVKMGKAQAQAMASTPVDVKMYGGDLHLTAEKKLEEEKGALKSGDVKVPVEDNVFVISCEKKLEEEEEEEKEGASKDVKMERRFGKFMRKFVMHLCCLSRWGLTVTELPPPEAKKESKTIEVKIV